MATGRVSLNPATFVEGGLKDDFDGEIVKAAFCYWDYDKGGESYLFLGMVIRDMADGKEFPQYYSAGDKEYFEPSEDGGYLKAKGDRGALNSNTNTAQFLNSLIAAGFPQQRLDEAGINEALSGLKCHWNRVSQPKRKGLIKTGPQGGEQERDKTVLLVSAILGLPGQQVVTGKKPGLGVGVGVGVGVGTSPLASKPVIAATTTSPVAGAGTGLGSAPATAGNGQAAVAVDVELDEVCQLALYEILAESGGKVAKGSLPALAFKKLMQHPMKAKAVPRMYSVEFLSTCGGIAFDGATISMQ